MYLNQLIKFLTNGINPACIVDKASILQKHVFSNYKDKSLKLLKTSGEFTAILGLFGFAYLMLIIS